MSDDIKPAMRSEGDGAIHRHNEDQENVTDGNGAAPSPDIEAEAGQDPQAPNKKGEG